ncbi:MAG: phage minor capsid protein [Faecalibacterium sp.]
MLPPGYLDRLPDAFVQLWQQVEDAILQDAARRIAKTGTLTETANWQLWRYQQTEALRQDVIRLLAKYSGKSEDTIRRLMQQAAAEAMEREDAIYYHYGKQPPPYAESAALNNLLDAGARQTAGAWQNLTATTANTVTGAFERTLDTAWGKVSTGAFDYKTAIRQAVDSLADELPFVTYPSGHTDTLEVAARRAVLTGVNQTAGKLQIARMDEMGCEFVETTAHGGARPEHAAWQGRRFHRGGAVDYLGVHYPDFEAATGYGTGAGLCGWNCRHTFFSIFPELGSAPAWTQEELAALNEKCIEYNGKKYTRYEISQMQRARERNVRRWKKRYLAEDAAGLDTTNSAVRLKAARRSLAQFVRDTGGQNDSSRTSVAGFGRSAASRAAWAAKRAFTNPAQNDMIIPSS